VNVTGNLYASNAVTTTNVFATGNAVVTGNLTVSGAASTTGATTVNVTGNLYASNAVTTTNVFATGNAVVTGNLTVSGAASTTGRTILNVTGNINASNAVTTINVFTTNVYFASGLTAATPAATKGAFEFNGTGGVFYTTPQLVRGISPSHHFYMQNADVTFGALSGVPQAMFPAVTTGITLQTGKYYLHSSIVVSVTTSATAGNTTLGTVFTGGATYTMSLLSRNVTSTSAPGTLILSAPFNVNYNSTRTATTISATTTATSTATSYYTTFEGFIDVSAAGTFLPQLVFTHSASGTLAAATPGVRNGSFMYLEPLGPTNTIVNVGGWA
jgi:hypothetical protein